MLSHQYYMYYVHSKFRENILVFSKTECGKTCFLQKLALNKFFGKLVKREWVTGIEIGDQREAEVKACFSNKVEFRLAKTSKKLS